MRALSDEKKGSAAAHLLRIFLHIILCVILHVKEMGSLFPNVEIGEMGSLFPNGVLRSREARAAA